MTIKYSLCLLICQVIYSSLSAQVEFVNRLEIELKDGYSNEEVFEFGKNGLLLRSQKDEKIDNNKIWRYELYNTELEKITESSVAIHKKQKPVESFETDAYSHTFFLDRKGNYTIISLLVRQLKKAWLPEKYPKKP